MKPELTMDRHRSCVSVADADLTAFVMDELDGATRRQVEAHLTSCEPCRQEIEARRRVLDRLRVRPPAAVSHDLALELLARVAAGEARRPILVSAWPTLLRVAAALVLVLGGAALCWHLSARGSADAGVAQVSTSPTAQAVAWLCRTQEPDGSWSTTRWGGSRQYEVALTGLSLLSLLEAEGPAASERTAAADRAVQYLCGRQNERGEFGTAFDGAPYNQGMATLALLRAYRAHPDATLKHALDGALGTIAARQLHDGGWGYIGTQTPASNLSITLWQVEALRLAVALGWDSARVPAARGLRWIATVAADDGSFGYRQSGDFPEGARTLTAMGAMSLLDVAEGNLVPAARRAAIQARVQRLSAANPPDLDYYGRYFLSAALKRMEGDTARQQLDSMQHALAALQVRQGSERGSWNADDRWSTAGGRVYATALASMSMR